MQQDYRRQEWFASKRIVIKIGSSLLVEPDNYALRHAWLKSLITDIEILVKQGKDVILVSSGAIALGRNVLNLPKGQLKLNEAQAAAALGQFTLGHAYNSLFSEHGLKSAQLLLTLMDTERRRRYLNARETISTLLDLNVIPIINENDTVATEEIRFGDNDRLAARVAAMMSADCLVVLSDVDGLYDSPPDDNPQAKHLAVIDKITPEIEAMAGETSSDLARGGMITKVKAAEIAVKAGCHMVITCGHVDHPLSALSEGARASWFLSTGDPIQARKSWIAGSIEPKGTIIIDEGALSALQAGKSLLPAGVVEIKGTFERGDAVVIKTGSGKEVGRGLTAFCDDDATKIIGKQSDQIMEILKFSGRTELVHRDNMVLK